MDVFETDYKGYPYNVDINTKGICCAPSSEVEQISQYYYFEKIISLLKNLFYSDSKLYVISYCKKKGKFNSIEKSYGIWKKLKQKNIVFRNTNNEIYLEENGEALMIAYSEVIEDEIINLFRMQFPIIVITKENIISELYNTDFYTLNSPNEIKTYLLNKNAVIIENLNLLDEGCSLFIYGKQNNSSFDCELVKKTISKNF